MRNQSIARCTLDEAGAAIGVDRRRAHQLERAAFRKLREALMRDPEVRAALAQYGLIREDDEPC